MNNYYDIGDLVRISGAFYDKLTSDIPVDPTTVTLTIRKPSGVLVTKTYPADITRIILGSYYADISVDVSGMWYYRWASTGVGQAAEEGSFWVRSSEVI